MWVIIGNWLHIRQPITICSDYPYQTYKNKAIKIVKSLFIYLL